MNMISLTSGPGAGSGRSYLARFVYYIKIYIIFIILYIFINLSYLVRTEGRATEVDVKILHYVALLLVDQFDSDDFLLCWTTYDHLDEPRTKTKNRMIDRYDF